MLDEEGRLGRPEARRSSKAPADEALVGVLPFVDDRIAKIGARCAERGKIGREHVGIAGDSPDSRGAHLPPPRLRAASPG